MKNKWPKGTNTPSVKRHVKRQGPIGMHCDAPKWTSIATNAFQWDLATWRTAWRSVCLQLKSTLWRRDMFDAVIMSSRAWHCLIYLQLCVIESLDVAQCLAFRIHHSFALEFFLNFSQTAWYHSSQNWPIMTSVTKRNETAIGNFRGAQSMMKLNGIICRNMKLEKLVVFNGWTEWDWCLFNLQHLVSNLMELFIWFQ